MRTQITLTLPVDRNSPEPLYYQLATSLKNAIEIGQLAHGSHLPPETQLAEQMKLSRNTIRNAWAYLEKRASSFAAREAEHSCAEVGSSDRPQDTWGRPDQLGVSANYVKSGVCAVRSRTRRTPYAGPSPGATGTIWFATRKTAPPARADSRKTRPRNCPVKVP
ncbi:GntR family transcriptional regulator [Arthrobacter sp. ov118]|uniref:winged helix-turn-helix domain-containing protein n=1 Tax=Arthrobacter sp. ov118 TaxID=1761747 RepID=UPI000B89696F